MKRSTARLLPFLTIFSLAGLALLLSSCNLRENMLLPPNLDPKEYLVSSQILVYSDHLIPSSNDNSYLYLPKTSIADSLIWYGDKITLSRVESFLERDSLAISTGAFALSPSHRIEILRAGQSITIENAAAFATIYTDMDDQFCGTMYQLSLRHILKVDFLKLAYYGKRRGFYEVDGSGDFAAICAGAPGELSVPANNTDVQGLILGLGYQIQFFIPAGFTDDLGAARITVQDPQDPSFDPAELQGVQEVYPNFALRSKIISVSTEREGTSIHTPILHYQMADSKSFSVQWVKQGRHQIESWPEGEDTWRIQDDTLITFINGAGSYFLLQALASQNTIRISLDSPYRQIFLQDMWLDLKDVNLPGIELLIDPNPNYDKLLQDYFGGRPYTLTGSSSAYQLSFLQGSQLLDTLPGDNWVEFGFASSLPDLAKARLMRAYRSPEKDILSYKTHADAYDAKHFTSADGYVYTGINSSGLYLLGNITESSSSHLIPCLKDELFLQTARTAFSYQDTKLPCTALKLEYNPSISSSSHPWLNSLPYALQGGQALLSISPIGSTNDALPQQLFIETTVSQGLKSVINFSPQAGYPKFVRYRKSNILEHNSFLQEGLKLSISPAYAGYLIDGNNLQNPAEARNLALFPRMVFDDYDLELYLDSPLPLPPSTMRIFRSGSLSDSYNVLEEQYQLSYLSPAYSFEMLNNADFYTKFQPYIRIKHPSRSQDLLFSVSNEEHYRIYSYPEGQTADGWHFMNRDGHYAFYLPYDAEYAVLRDNDPHSTSELTISAAQAAHLSLYQAQASFPGDYIGSSIPLGSKLSLVQINSVAAGISFRAAYRLGMLGPQQNPMQPNFFSQPNSDWPYLYIPIPDYVAGEPVRAFYRDAQGNTQERTRVQSFTDSPGDEFIVLGNCAITFIDNPGIFYLQ